MKKIVIMFCCLIFFSSCSVKEISQNVFSNKTEKIYENTMKRDLLSLMMAYPEHITNVIKDNNGNVYIVMKSGNKILYDDKKNKNYIEKVNNPDLQDMMEQIYPINDIVEIMPKDYDPGRIRVYSLLNEVYGYNRNQIEKKLVNVKAGYINCQFSGSNNAGSFLKKAMDEVTSISKHNSKVSASVYPTSGTYNFRFISGTKRLSPHSFGIAIDLRRDKRDYWKWANKEQGQKRLDEYPREIVKVFEKNYFVWGGKWNHFDILHFEYRPELIIKGRYFSDNSNINKPWYDGITFSTSNKSYIDIIEKALN